MFLIALIFLPITNAAYCSGTPKPDAQTNNYTIMAQNLTLLRTVENGKLYEANSGTPLSFFITHVYGKPYEQGFAHGQLLSDEIQSFMKKMIQYFDSSLTDSLPGPQCTFTIFLLLRS